MLRAVDIVELVILPVYHGMLASTPGSSLLSSFMPHKSTIVPAQRPLAWRLQLGSKSKNYTTNKSLITFNTVKSPLKVFLGKWKRLRRGVGSQLSLGLMAWDWVQLEESLLGEAWFSFLVAKASSVKKCCQIFCVGLLLAQLQF